ncbi:MAG: AraC family transcriptional regulator [Bacteroidetes bacterium]|nr:MAG: AraC family transcriptional regulator [Bacteroidota bacterium]
MKQVHSFTPDSSLRLFIRDYSFRCLALAEPRFIPSTKGNVLDIPIREVMPFQEKEGEFVSKSTPFLVGIQTQHNRDLCLMPGLCMWAIQFEPYAAPFLFDIPTEHWANGIFSFDQDTKMLSLQAELLSLVNPEEAVSLFNVYFKDLLRQKKAADIQRLQGLQLILAELENPESSIGEVLEKSQVSERSLERSFKQYMGLSPKEYLRHLRFLKLIELNPELERSGTYLTYELGYFDQSHFIREFKHYTGMTPGAYAQSLKPIAELTY